MPGTLTADPERALLGVLLGYSDVPAQRLATERGLRPEHFARGRHGEVWRAILALTDRGSKADTATVAAELGWGVESDESRLLFTVQAEAGLPGAVDEYASRIIDQACARHAEKRAGEIKLAAKAGDLAEVARLADDVLPDDERIQQQSQEQLLEELWQHAEEGSETTLRWPWPIINGLLDGYWPGNLTILGGHEAHGKSIVADEVLESIIRKQEGTGCIYATEMTAKERAQRTIARYTRLPFDVVRRGKLDARDAAEYQRGMKAICWKYEVVGPRTAHDLARDIRRRRWTTAVIDLLNSLPAAPGDPRPRREQLEENVRVLASTAQETGTHIIACQHLNRNRLMGADYPPEPTLGDLRETSQLQQIATNVLFVYRYPMGDAAGVPTRHPGNEAYVEVAKAKNGRLGKQDLVFQGEHQRFVLPGRTA